MGRPNGAFTGPNQAGSGALEGPSLIRKASPRPSTLARVASRQTRAQENERARDQEFALPQLHLQVSCVRNRHTRCRVQKYTHTDTRDLRDTHTPTPTCAQTCRLRYPHSDSPGVLLPFLPSALPGFPFHPVCLLKTHQARVLQAFLWPPFFTKESCVCAGAPTPTRTPPAGS